MSSYLALDIGEKRIGVAVCDTTATFPAPITTLEATPSLAEDFSRLLQQYSVVAVVVGLPRNQQGERTAQTDRVEQIVKLMNIPDHLPVYWQDESLTSVKAEEELNRRKKPFKKADVDALAATFILDDFVRFQLPGLQKPLPNASPVDHHTKVRASVPKKTKKTKSRIFLSVFIFSVIAVLSLVVGAITWYNLSLAPKTSDDQYQVITVKIGSSTQAIANNLHQKGLIKSAAAFSLYVRLNNILNLQAGTYRLSSKASAIDIAKTIASGKVTTVNVLISPGLRLDQIKSALEKDGYIKEDIEKALKSVRNHPLLKNVASDARLEGYLFPDTYKIGPDTSVEQLIRLMLDNFENKVTKEISDGLQKQGLTLDQAVILASIVQKEVADPKVQPTVAQVFIKRFKEGIVLGSDVTYKYAAAQFGDVDLPSSTSPYNTRKYMGLPPTAIANFNISALQAVAYPTNTTYNFFVAGDDGTTHFSRTVEEHEALVRKYCTTQCQ